MYKKEYRTDTILNKEKFKISTLINKKDTINIPKQNKNVKLNLLIVFLKYLSISEYFLLRYKKIKKFKK